jgi:diguanylate cyclase (GGDEF)-like protein
LGTVSCDPEQQPALMVRLRGEGRLDSYVKMAEPTAAGDADAAPRGVPPLDYAHERTAVTAGLLEAASRLIVHSDPLGLMRGACESLVAATPHIRLAWAWYGDAAARRIRPMISAGPAKAYTDDLVVEKNVLARLAFRALAPDAPDSAAAMRFSLFNPWRVASRKYGFEIAVALPLGVPSPAELGLLVIYADDASYFDVVGTAPFRAFAVLAEAALAQADFRTQLQQQATHDALTQLPNRHRLRDELERLHANAVRYRHSYALVMFDLDRFKDINDEHGHDVGDRALVTAAQCATVAVRRGDLVGRWGGDEFLAILPNTELDAAIVMANRLRDEMCGSGCAVNDAVIPLRASFGVAAYPASADSTHAVLVAADRALYRAKREGGDRVAVADSAG